ncbi:DEAD/DEAH box helicase family protein [Haloferula sp.]|uniref:DEAD/DEAH box helicase family protein n=1 Tax=Haloferula sp. TaxID=2497595 RepID=UPI003C714C88
MPNEAQARLTIDRLLREVGWDIENPSRVSVEEAAADGRADYVLKNQRGQPIAVIEAKRFTTDPYGAKSQAKAYAVQLAAPFVILSNGRDHYFWEHDHGDARPVVGFSSPEDLERRANVRVHRLGDLETSIHAIPIPRTFRSQGEDCTTRPYQIECLEKADEALITGRRRMLFEMATGTGKTMTVALLIKRWLQAGVVSRVLFLADRIELARQAHEDFSDYLRAFPLSLLFNGKRSIEGQIVVGTLDTIAGQLGPGGFGHAHFDLVITDECHRSIYNTHRATLGHFDAIHIGLTATPNPGELRWVSHHERQLVRSTYMFFDCWDSAAEEGRPTFGYTLRDGIRDKFLADYRIYLAETRLTFEGVEWDDEQYRFSDWGKTVESVDRLKLIIEEYFRVEEERPQSHPRKTIVFSVGERQATIIARLFNKLLPDDACLRIATQTNRSPGEVRQSFAEKITCYSNNNNPRPLIDAFKFDPLPIIAVSVDMLDTGYNHKEVENLVMLRPTSSALKYAQMRGRGSRLCPRIGKTSFLIYDFVNNHATFNDSAQEYHRPRAVGRRPGEDDDDDTGGGPPPPPPTPPQPREFVTIAEGEVSDEFRRREMILVGPEGLAIDRHDYQDRWRERVIELRQTDPVVGRILSGEAVSEDEWEALRSKLASPDWYFDEHTLKKAFDQPSGSLDDFIRAALGLITLPTREERVERAFNAWLTQHSDAERPEQAHILSLLRNVVLASLKETKYQVLDPIIFTRPPFTFLGGRVRAETIFGGRDGLRDVLEELNAIITAA